MESGDVAQIKQDVVIDGQTAFRAEEQVVIEGINPDANNPSFRYIVTSRINGKKYLLSDREALLVLKASPPATPGVAAGAPPGPPGLPPQRMGAYGGGQLVPGGATWSPPGAQVVKSGHRVRKSILIVAAVVIGLVVILGVIGIVLENRKVGNPTSSTSVEPGWTQYDARGLKISLPSTWKVGITQKELDDIASKLKSLGGAYQNAASQLENNSGAISLYAISQEPGSLAPANVTVLSSQMTSDSTLDEMIKQTVAHLPAGLSVTNQSKTNINGTTMGQLLLDANVGGIQEKSVMCIILSGGTGYAISYTCLADQYGTFQPTFQKSINSVKMP